MGDILSIKFYRDLELVSTSTDKIFARRASQIGWSSSQMPWVKMLTGCVNYSRLVERARHFLYFVIKEKSTLGRLDLHSLADRIVYSISPTKARCVSIKDGCFCPSSREATLSASQWAKYTFCYAWLCLRWLIDTSSDSGVVDTAVRSLRHFRWARLHAAGHLIALRGVGR